MWEKKDEVGGIHDVDNRYTWARCCDGTCSTLDDCCQPNAAAAAACSAQTGGAVGCSECPAGTCDIDPQGSAAITTIWDWLVQLNAEGGTGFASHSHWRMASEDGCNRYYDHGACRHDPRELESILLEPYECGVSPCIDPIFGPTALSHYWSPTSNASIPYLARTVFFGDGYVYTANKSFFGRVRAVRGDSPSAAFMEATSGLLD